MAPAQLVASIARRSSVHLVGLLVGVLPTAALGEAAFESAYTQFFGRKLRADVGALNMRYTGDHLAESGYATQVSVRQTLVKSTKLDISDEEMKSFEQRTSIGLDQTIATLSSIGFNYSHGLTTGFTRSENRYTTLRFGHWWNKSTLLTEVEMTRSQTNRAIRDYLDTDGVRIRTEPTVSGNTYTLGTTWLATTFAMILAKASKSMSSDRPIAHAGQIEGRLFISDTSTAVHLKLGAYNDQSKVEKTTDYGEIHARNIETQLHQHITDQWIAAVIHRRHWEIETPRSSESREISRRTDSSQVRLRWRYVTGPITDSVPEIYAYLGQYITTETQAFIRHIGLGGKYVL